jgi:hypothetical protein
MESILFSKFFYISGSVALTVHQSTNTALEIIPI